MGQALSEHELFVAGLSKALKARGIKVKTKDLLQYFQFIHKVCPWFPPEGSIDTKRWERVGDALKDYYKTFGPEKVPVISFSYWTLISELLTQRHTDPKIDETLTQGEAALRSSCNPSPKPPSDTSSVPSHPSSVILDIPEPLQDGDLPPPSLSGGHEDSKNGAALPDIQNGTALPDIQNGAALPATQNGTTTRPPPYQPMYPDLSDSQEVDWSQLAEEAAQYHDPPFAAPVLPNKLSSAPQEPPNPSSAFSNLKAEIQDLQLQLKQKKQQLILQLQSLDIDPPSSAPKMAPTPGPLQGAPAMLFPVTETTLPPQNGTPHIGEAQNGAAPPAPQVIRAHAPFTIAALKELKTAVTQYGPTATFTLAVLDSMTQGWIIPNEWKDLAKASLSGGHYLLWKSEFKDQCELIARDNANRQQNPWTFPMLAGTGDFNSKEAQMQYDPGLFAQINAAAYRAWRKLPPSGEVTSSLTNIRQRPEEPFCDFVDRLLQAAERLFGSPESNSALIKQLAYENATSACQAAIRPHKTKEDLSGYIRLCADIGPAHLHAQVTAAAVREVLLAHKQGGKTNNGKCFNCDQIGHFVKDCPKAPQSPNAKQMKNPNSLCPKCKKGYHWARECKSKFDKEGNPLPQQGNGIRGQPQTPNQGQAPGAIRFVPAQNHPMQNNPFQTSSAPHQEVQDWTSVPPPIQY